MPLVTRITAKVIVSKFLTWAEKRGWAYNTERPFFSEVLVPALAAFLELMLGHEIDDEVQEKLLRERRKRAIDGILKKH